MALMRSAAVRRSDRLGCAAMILFLGMTAGPLYLALHARLGHPLDGWAALVGALVSFVAFGMLQESVQLSRDERLARAAVRGAQLFRDGEPAVVSGTIEAAAGHEPIEAPFTGRACLAYVYNVSEPRSKDINHSAVALYVGHGCVPSEVRTPQGPLRILASPGLGEMQSRRCTDPEERRRAIAYVQSATFETLTIFQWGRISRLGRELLAECGAVRKDFQCTFSPRGIESCSFSETIIEPGAVVTVKGVYSADRRGLAPDGNDPDFFRVIPGDADSVARELRSRARWRSVAALMMVVVIYPIIWIVASHIRLP
jgi:hypothetical protein